MPDETPRAHYDEVLLEFQWRPRRNPKVGKAFPGPLQRVGAGSFLQLVGLLRAMEAQATHFQVVEGGGSGNQTCGRTTAARICG